MTTSDTILHEPPCQPKRRRRSLLAVLAAASGLGLIGTGAVLAVPAAASATTRPLLRGKVASLGTDSFTVTAGAATVTVDVSTTTTYADAAVSGASFTTLSVGSRVAVEGTLAGTNLVDASTVRILPARPLLRGKVASLGTDSFTVTAGAATVTVDVSTTTTYADAAVSGASFTTLSVGSRVAVEGTLAGTNLVDASTVRILPSTPIGRRPVFRLGLGEARLGAGLGRVRGAVAFVPLSCRGGSCRGTLRLSVTELVGRHDELVPAGAATYTMAAGSDHLVAVRLAPRALSELVRARGRRLVATATILGAGRHSVVERLELFA
jgi:hypothetical protein